MFLVPVRSKPLGDILLNILTIVSALILLSGAVATAGELCFSRAFFHPVGNGPYTVCPQDLNNDGNMDYIVSNYEDNSISVYRTNSLDNFVSENIYTVGFDDFGGPAGMTTADFNGDQYIDIVFAASTANVIGVMKGTTNGQFLPPNYYDVGSGPIWVAAGDIDNDGDNDIATADAGSGTISILRNNGTGIFTYDTNHLVGLSPHCVLLRDFDGDSDLDFVSINRKSQDLCILYNDSSGNFSNRTRYVTDQEPWNVVADDFDSDGDLDLMVTNHIQDKVEVFINDASGHFTHGESYFVGERPMGIIAVDLNGDSLNDLAVTNYESKSQSILISIGGAYEPAVEALIGGSAITLTSTDHNHDGQIDLIFPLVNVKNMMININQLDKGFPEVLGMPSDNSGGFTQAVDLNNDGFKDMIFTNVYEDNISVTYLDYLGRPDHTFYFPTPDGPVSAFAADFDRDGDNDIAVSTIFPGKIALLINNGSGLFLPGDEIPVDYSLSSIQGADFDNDGDIDLVSKVTGSNTSPGLMIFENDGAGGFTYHPEIVFSIYDAYSTWAPCSDINNDGDLDLVIARGPLVIYYGTDGLNFLPAVQLPVPGNRAWSVAVADFDGDGDLDIAANHTSQNQIIEFINDGTGVFTTALLGVAPASFNNQDYSFPIDIDANGWTDIVLSSVGSYNNVTVLLNDAGVFAAPESMHIGNSDLYGFFDIEGNGVQDLVVGSEDFTITAIHLNCNAPNYLLGDCNDDKKVNISDAVFLLNYIFAGGPAPDPRLRGDINSDSLVNISDVVRIINYLFMGEPL